MRDDEEFLTHATDRREVCELEKVVLLHQGGTHKGHPLQSEGIFELNDLLNMVIIEFHRIKDTLLMVLHYQSTSTIG